MAEANDSPMLDEVDEAYVTCQICLNIFDDVGRKPKYLGCHHYFCLGCAQALVKEDSIVCPLCRLKTKITGTIGQLTTNTIILRMLEKMNPTGAPLNIDHSVLAPTAKLWCTVCAQDAKFCSSTGTHNLLNSETFCKEMISCFHKSRDDLKNRCSTIAQKIHGTKNRLEGVLEALDKIKDVVQTELDSCQLGLETLEYLLVDGDQLPEPSSVDVQTCKAELSRTVADLDKLKREAVVVGFIADEKAQSFQLVEKHHLLMELTRAGKESAAKLPQALHNLPLFFEAKVGNHYPGLLQGFIPIVAFSIASLSSTSSLPGAKTGKDGGKKLQKAASSSHILPSTDTMDKKTQSKAAAGSKDKGKTLPLKKPSLEQNQAPSVTSPSTPRTPLAFDRAGPPAGQMTEGHTLPPLSRTASVDASRLNQVTTGASVLNAPMEFSELMELLNRSPGNQQRQQGHEAAGPVVSRQSSLPNPAQATLQRSPNSITSTTPSPTATPRTAPTLTSIPADPNHYTSVDDSYYLVPNSLTLPTSPPPVPERQKNQPSRPLPRPRQPAIRPELPPRPGRSNE